MLAMNFRGPRRVRVDQKPEPEIRHPQDAIVRVTRACICGSDLHLYNGSVPDTRIGTTFGHETVGYVEEVGPEVQNLKAGDHVLIPFNIACGKCVFCRQQLYGNCHESNPEATAVGGIFGYSHTAGGYDGGQAEYVRVPYADVGPMKIPEWMDEDTAVMLTDVTPTGYQAAEMGGIQQGDTVCVFGAGPVGIMAARCAWLFGAGRVIVIDHIDYRLEFAKEWCPAEVYNYKEIPDVVQFMKETTDWIGADVCIDAVGAEATGRIGQTLMGKKMHLLGGAATALQWAINSVRKGGVISVVGVYGPVGALVPIGNIVNKGLTLRGNQASVKRLLPRLVEHVENGILTPKDLITHHIPLEDIGDGYKMFSMKLDNMIKPVVVPPRATSH
ncbi:MAG: zinc-dependent alcohol dehydrogenase [Pyrinomonadaceae bacterium]